MTLVHDRLRERMIGSDLRQLDADESEHSEGRAVGHHSRSHCLAGPLHTSSSSKHDAIYRSSLGISQHPYLFQGPSDAAAVQKSSN